LHGTRKIRRGKGGRGGGKHLNFAQRTLTFPPPRKLAERREDGEGEKGGYSALYPILDWRGEKKGEKREKGPSPFSSRKELGWGKRGKEREKERKALINHSFRLTCTARYFGFRKKKKERRKSSTAPPPYLQN